MTEIAAITNYLDALSLNTNFTYLNFCCKELSLFNWSRLSASMVSGQRARLDIQGSRVQILLRSIDFFRT